MYRSFMIYNSIFFHSLGNFVEDCSNGLVWLKFGLRLTYKTIWAHEFWVFFLLLLE